ncbi:hypothetical protein GCM10027162_74270 [Streptomyces incanus]
MGWWRCGFRGTHRFHAYMTGPCPSRPSRPCPSSGAAGPDGRPRPVRRRSVEVPMHVTAELIGALAALLGLGILTLASVRSITRR